MFTSSPSKSNKNSEYFWVQSIIYPSANGIEFSTLFRFAALLICNLCLLSSCQDTSGPYKSSFETYLSQDDLVQTEDIPTEFVRSPEPVYPWDPMRSHTTRINKYHFCCGGSIEHPIYETEKGWFSDCSGGQVHSLPLKNNEEWISPILITLLNDLQDHFETAAVVLCGHCCPIHYRYRVEKGQRAVRRHMMGAAVDFKLKKQKAEQTIEYLVERANWYSADPLSPIDPTYSHSSKAWENRHFKIHLLENYESDQTAAIRIEVFHDPIINEIIRFQWDTTEQLYIY